MNGYADPEISLHRHASGSYAIEFRYNLPGSDAEVRLGQGEANLADISLDRRRSLQLDPADYGQELTKSLFADPAVQTAFAEARRSAQAQSYPLRLRLLIGASAPELHGVRWETLNDPKDGTPLCTTQDLFISRYLSSMDWRLATSPRAKINRRTSDE